MRKTLVAAVALAPLCLVASRGVALATDTISSGATSPVATATATSGGPDSIDVASGGSVTVSGSVPAVTLNSGTIAVPNNVSVEGAININEVNNSVGIQALGGAAGSISVSGSITNSESFTATTNSDGFAESPFASTTSTGRYGVQVTGTGTLIGDVDNLGSIGVKGDNSYAISIESPIAGATGSTATGSLFDSGTLTYTGDNGAALRSLAGGNIAGQPAGGNIAGQVEITGTITSQGTNSSAINLAGDVGGRIAIYSAITNTGYASTTRPTTTSQLNNLQEPANANQVNQSAGAVIITGNVGGGILIGAPPVGTTTTTTADLDGDGFQDGVEGTGSITNFGNAPALTIGGVQATTIGVVGTVSGETALPENNYGLIIRGALSGQGVYDGVAATGLLVGTGATITGGVRVVGSISADSFEANATAIHIYGGANVAEIRNEDFIEASISHSVVATTDPVVNLASGHPDRRRRQCRHDHQLRHSSGHRQRRQHEGLRGPGPVGQRPDLGAERGRDQRASVTPVTVQPGAPLLHQYRAERGAGPQRQHHRLQPDPGGQPEPDRGGGQHHHQLLRRTVTTTAALTTATATTTTTVTTTTVRGDHHHHHHHPDLPPDRRRRAAPATGPTRSTSWAAASPAS